MEKQLLQSGQVFEITDYTTASDWERFIASLEEILLEWKLGKHESISTDSYIPLPSKTISSGIWHEKHDIIRFGRVSFDVRYQYLDLVNKPSGLGTSMIASENNKEYPAREHATEYQDSETEDLESDQSGGSSQVDIPTEDDKEHGEYEIPERLPDCLRDMLDPSNDYASKAHCLVRWYNLRSFIVLSPKGDTIVSEDRVKLILSSASIALANTNCPIPIFVQIHNPRNSFYQGISDCLNIRNMFEMVFFKRCLKQYSYLSELISIFREKVGCTLNDPISVTARLNYCLSIFDLFTNSRDLFSGNEHSDPEQDELLKMDLERKRDSTKIWNQDMRSFATFEQVTEVLDSCVTHPYKILRFIHLAAIWPPVSDKVITDSQVHSDLDPAEAPIWTIRCVASDNCNLKIVHITQALYELFKSAVDYSYNQLDASSAFEGIPSEVMKQRCLKLCYDLSIQPEVVLSERPTNEMRKLVALLFYRAAEIMSAEDALDQIAGRLKKKPSLSEIYRSLAKKSEPSVKEFIIRTQVSRPFSPISTPALPQRMFCTVCDEEFRLCGSFSELCN